MRCGTRLDDLEHEKKRFLRSSFIFKVQVVAVDINASSPGEEGASAEKEASATAPQEVLSPGHNSNSSCDRNSISK